MPPPSQRPLTMPIPSSSSSSASAPIQSIQSTSPSILARTQKFIEDNQRMLIIGASVAVVGGIGYLIYSNQKPRKGSSGSSSSTSPGSESVGGSKKKSKGKKKKSGGSAGSGGSGMKDGFLKNEGSEGPLLEEIKNEKEVEEKEKDKGSPTISISSKEEAGPLDDIPSGDELAKMSESDRNAKGAELKDRGNKFYSKKEFQKAVECYTKAIEVSIRRDAVFYSNRAACYTNYSPPEYENCVADCDEALKLDHTYVKALKRRATALENLGRDEEAVRDFTATTIIERFQDEAAAASVERCLKKLAEKKAREAFEKKEPKLPSPTFVSSYLAAFRPHDKPTLPTNGSQGDRTLMLAFDALSASDYTHALSFVNEAIDQGISWKEGQAEAFNLRGTFKFLVGDSLGAKEDLEKSLDLVPNLVQSWVKIASVHMELGDAVSAFGDFEAAIRHNPNDPDIYYHRGQVYFIMQEFDKAISDYTKSTELDSSFIFTHVQAAVAQYKLGQTGPSMAAFRRILKQFPDRGEPSNYYGELLLDQQKFGESVERFDRSLELDKNKKPRNVLPLVNKSLAIFQWKQDISQAEQLCKEALEIDPDCDVAVATLAQLSLQQGKIEEAIKWFEKSGQLARTEGELVNAITYEYASRAQQAFLKNYPEFAERLSQVAAGM